MITVKLIAQTDKDVTTLSSHAAKTCYTATVPEMGALIDVRARLFQPGHHTTIEHNSFTFNIDGASVSSVVFGLHLNAPYYNSDQRSGRFSKMYIEPDLDEIDRYLKTFYPTENTAAAVRFIGQGLDVYRENIDRLTTLAAEAIRTDRPLANDKYIAQNAPKFAQEQLRMFVSQVMPTSLDMTLDMSALCALWRVAWSPEMRMITDQMRDEVLRVQPDLSYMFAETARQNRDWSPRMNMTRPSVHTEPTCILLSADPVIGEEPTAKDSVDILPFSPMAMNNNTATITSEVSVSCATMGQDQRHRSIRRGEPVMTGAFYLPPLLKMAGMQDVALQYMQSYADLSHVVSPALMTTIAPYGVMVMYRKSANWNALRHEQGKRLCWCAQEEIYELSCQLRDMIKNRVPALADRLAPPCYQGTCREGVRFCGRQCNRTATPDYFVRRRV